VADIGVRLSRTRVNEFKTIVLANKAPLPLAPLIASSTGEEPTFPRTSRSVQLNDPGQSPVLLAGQPFPYAQAVTFLPQVPVTSFGFACAPFAVCPGHDPLQKLN